MAQLLSARQEATFVWECWFRDCTNGAAMSIHNLTQIICAYYDLDKEFVYECDYDGNGIVFWVGTHYGEQEWVNPALRGLIRVNSSGWSSYGSVDDIVGNKACNSFSAENEGAWLSIEFIDDVMVKPTGYTLAHARSHTLYALRDWVLEGSVDGNQWKIIKQHISDRAFETHQSHTWSALNVDAYFNRFRVRMTKANLSGWWRLMTHALEIYGFVRHC